MCSFIFVCLLLYKSVYYYLFVFDNELFWIINKNNRHYCLLHKTCPLQKRAMDIICVFCFAEKKSFRISDKKKKVIDCKKYMTTTIRTFS